MDRKSLPNLDEERLIAINRDSGQPVYLQLAEILHQKILAGIYEPGSKLPSEAMVCDEYDVSPMTVRRAINYLAAQDVISTHKGKGTFVKSVELEDAAFYLRDLSAVFGKDGETQIKVIEAKFVPASERISRKLDIALGEKAIFLGRLLLINNEPAFYHRGYLVNIPDQPIVEAELEVTDLKGIFQGSGSSLIKFGQVLVESTILDEREAELLNLQPGCAGMMLEHTFFGFDDKPLSWGWFVCGSHQLKLQASVGLTIEPGVRDERTR